MNAHLRIPLRATPGQFDSLLALQAEFARACNALAPLVRQTRTWNRVALHHLAYKMLREQFPGLGSQMACNAIYSVSRTCRQVFQHPDSPLNLARLGGRALPLLNFADTCPVYFDRHTLSVRDGQLSLYTLDGRVRFDVNLGPAAEAAFREKKLREVVLLRERPDAFELCFLFGEAEAPAPRSDAAVSGEIPGYVLVEEAS